MRNSRLLAHRPCPRLRSTRWLRASPAVAPLLHLQPRLARSAVGVGVLAAVPAASPSSLAACAAFATAMTAARRAFTSIPLRHTPLLQKSGDDAQLSLASCGLTSSTSLGAAQRPPRTQGRWANGHVRAVPRPRSQRSGEDGSLSPSPVVPLPHDGRGAPDDALPSEVCVPRILFFGGDVVSLTALEALYERLECIARRAFALQEASDAEGGLFPAGAKGESSTSAGGMRQDASSPEGTSKRKRGSSQAHRDTRRAERAAQRQQRCFKFPSAQSGDRHDNSHEARHVRTFVQDHLTIICPHLPHNISPEEAARRHHRQYPVARFAVEKGLPVIPVDHPRSLVRSQLLQDMLRDNGAAATRGVLHARQQREQQQHAERERRRRCETFMGRVQTFWERHCGRAMAAAAGAATLLPSPTRCAAAARSASPTAPLPATTAAAAMGSPLTEGVSTPWTRHGRPLKDFDLAVVVSFRYFLPARLLEALPPTINMHPSLLPLYRGASPIFSTLMRNETVGGASIIQLRADQKMMDSGNLVWQCELPIPKDMDIRTYMPLVTQLGAAGLCDTVFGEQPARNPIWRQRSDALTGAADSGDESAVCETSGTTVNMRGDAGGEAEDGRPCGAAGDMPRADPASAAAPSITPAVIAAALQAHRRYVLYCEHCALTGTVPSSPSATHRELRCADVFPGSVRNSYCDWPDTFWFSWRTAPPQQYATFSHFSQDPFHAPLLPRDAAVLRFSEFTGDEAFGRWRAFIGGQYFQPAVNATLDKSCTPVRNQLAKRTLRRLVREKLKRLGKTAGGKETRGAPSPQGGAGADTHGDGTERRKPSAGADAGSTPRSPSSLPPKDPFTIPSAAAGKAAQNHRGWPREKGKRKRTQKAAPIDLDAAASIIDTDMLRSVEEDLRLSCTFTKAVHPDLVAPAVLAEMEAVEWGEPLTAESPQGPAAVDAVPTGGCVRRAARVCFYRQPPPLFSAAQLCERVKAAEEARRQQRRRDCLTRRAAHAEKSAAVITSSQQSTTVDVLTHSSSSSSSSSSALCRKDQRAAVASDLFGTTPSMMMTSLTLTVRRSFLAMLPPALATHTRGPALATAEGKAAALAPADTGLPEWYETQQGASSTAMGEMTAGQGDEGEEDEEAARRATGLVLLKAPELRTALADEDEEEGAAEACRGEEAPRGYVPDVIPLAPPLPTVLPWLADISEEVGIDFLESERVEQAEEAALAAAARRAEKEAAAIRRNTIAKAAAPSSREAEQKRDQSRRKGSPLFHIPTGTAYFPLADEHIGAIKCKEGWFFWQEAHLKAATRAQPVVLLRKGMAMRQGILYAGLFSEYCK